MDLREGIDFSIYLLGAFEPSTLAAYRRILRPGAVAIDVGANIGAHSLPLAAAVGPSGTVIAVEPTRYAFERLADQISLNKDLAPQIRTHQAMLMSSGGAALAAALPSSWPLAASETGHEHHLGVSKPTTGAVVTTLDDIVAEHRLSAIDLIKLDVDGYEIEVLQGASKVLNEYSPCIIFEYSPYTLVEKGYSPEELPGILTRAGYRFANLAGEPYPDGKTLPEISIGAGINVLARKPEQR